MKSMYRLLFAVLGCFSLTATATAQSWQFVGSRAMGMGGAGVATAYGPDAQNWNPAGLAQDEDLNETGLLLNAGADLQATKNVLEAVRNLTDMSKQYKALSKKIDGSDPSMADAADISTLFKGLNDISQLIGNGTGALVNANGAIGLKIKNFAVTGRALGTGSIIPVIDTENIKFKVGATGLTLGATTNPSVPANADQATRLKNAIDAYGLFAALNDLLGGGYANSAALANAFVNAIGSDTATVENTVNTIVENLGGSAEILNKFTSASGTYEQNNTLAMADAATFGEMALGYGTRVIPGLKLGANLKVIHGYTAQSGVMILKDDQEVKDIFDKAYDNKKSSTNFAVDAGALLNLSELFDKEILLNPQVGFTAKNINGPEFDRPDVPAELIGTPIADNWNHDKYQLKPQLRAGAAINPIKNITLAADLDITENDTMIAGVKSRQLGVGMEINLFNRPKFHIPLRVGYNTNLAESNVSDFYTAGIGLNMLHFYVELAAAVSSDTTKVDDTTVPNSAAVSLSLGFLF